ncbi:hypothetical protein IWW48_001488 [Coemansia sp. RSA 1200]|nr:hypothetical protein IWW48_001488 [Coemansia sp. RSA 1200]
MKFKLGVSVLVLALATTAQPAVAKRPRGGVHKREIAVGDQSLTVAANAASSHKLDSTTEEHASAVPTYQIAQLATVTVDGSLTNAHVSVLTVNDLQSSQSLSQAVSSPQLPVQGVQANQRVVDTSQLVLQAQAAPQAPVVPSVAPVTVVQTVAANPVVMTVTQVSTIAPAAANQAALLAPAPAPAPAPAVAQAYAPGAASAMTPSLAQVASAPFVQAAAPIAASAPLAAQMVIPGTAQAPVANLPEGVLSQPISALGAAVAEPAGVPLYAQQQLFPIAAAAQPIYQQQAAAALGNTPQPAIYLNGNQALPQAIIPLDQSIAELLTQTGTATLASSSAASKASSATSSIAAATDSLAANSGDDDALATTAPEDEDVAPINPRHGSGSANKTALSRTKLRQSKINADDAYADDSLAPNDNPADIVQDEQTDNDPVGVLSTGHRSKSTGKSAGSETRKKSVDREAAQDSAGLASVANFKVTSSPDTDDLAEDASAAEPNEAPSINRAHRTQIRNATGGLRAEARRIKSEASLEAREAVLSEIRAEASAEAALQASSELNLSLNTIVRDEEASVERTRTVYDSPQDYNTRDKQWKDSDGSDHAKETDYPETYSGGGVGRYATGDKEDTSTWDVHHAVSWASAHTNGYDDESQTTTYHPYEHSYDDDDKYAHNIVSYDEPSRDSTENGDWKVRYNGPHPTVYSASDESRTSFTVMDGESRTYSDNSYTPYSDNTYTSYSDNSSETLHESDTQGKPFNFVNMRADSALSRDAAAFGSLSSPSTDDAPHAVNELDPLSYGTQGYPLRDSLPLMATSADNGVASAHPSMMVIGIPQPMSYSAAPNSAAPPASTVMVTKMVTPAIEVVLASSSDES